MTDDKKRELFPYFAYIYSQQLNPERYGQVESIEDWTNLIQSNQDDIEKITQAAEQLSDEEWDALDQQYTEQAKASEDQQVISAKKGAKLMKLKKGAKKCKCGCDMITAKADGGKLVSKCACGCDVKKKEKGGEINKKIDRVKVAINKKQTGGDINQPNKVVAKKGAKLKPKMQTGGKYNESEHATLIEKYRNKKTSTPELRRLQELNRISGHHDDGWEPKKAKPEVKKPEPTKKPKTQPAKKLADRIGKHKLGGSIQKFWGGGPTPTPTPKTSPNYPEGEYLHDIITSTLGGFSLGPLNYIAKRAARGFDRLTDEAAEELAGNYRAAQSKHSVKVPVSNPRANPGVEITKSKTTPNYSEGGYGHDIVTSALTGFPIAPFNYLVRRAARSYMTDPVTSAPVSNPRANPRANPAYAAQVFSPDYIDRMIKAQFTGQPVMLPGVEGTAPKSNTSAGTTQSKPSGVAQGQSSGTAQGQPSYDTNTLWGWMKSTGYGDASFAGRRDLWNKFYGSGTTAATGYTGTADQNARLLDALKKANTMGVSTEKAANLTNMPLLKASPIKSFDPKKKLESKPVPAKESKPTK